NVVWDPARDGALLAAFMTTPPDAPVGLGLAVRTTQFDLASVTNPVPVRLSSFTTNFVSVDYSLQAPGQILASGTLQFAPGETVKLIALPAQPQSYDLLRLQLQNPQRAQITGQSVLWFARSTATANTVLVPAGSVWRYLDAGTNAGTAWHAPEYDDSGWPFGRAELGFGDSKDSRPEATQVRSNNITYYFRHAFVVTNPVDWSKLTVKLKRDDGGIVYLKDREIFRSNLADGPVDYLTRAALANDDGTTFYSTNAPASLLVAGTNVLAVEIHQESPTSSDVSFDLQLEGAPRPTLVPARFGQDWLLSWPEPTAVLEQADEITGPWSVVPASSPAQIDPVAPRKFYRLRIP
ncbi:MAG TPA: hypothetical protein VNZ22_18570, partial [Bacillota bacterium]|nr:hypothetical protein [Bacillota bacterium]